VANEMELAQNMKPAPWWTLPTGRANLEDSYKQYQEALRKRRVKLDQTSEMEEGMGNIDNWWLRPKTFEMGGSSGPVERNWSPNFMEGAIYHGPGAPDDGIPIAELEEALQMRGR